MRVVNDVEQNYLMKIEIWIQHSTHTRVNTSQKSMGLRFTKWWANIAGDCHVVRHRHHYSGTQNSPVSLANAHLSFSTPVWCLFLILQQLDVQKNQIRCFKKHWSICTPQGKEYVAKIRAQKPQTRSLFTEAWRVKCCDSEGLKRGLSRKSRFGHLKRPSLEPGLANA